MKFERKKVSIRNKFMSHRKTTLSAEIFCQMNIENNTPTLNRTNEIWNGIVYAI